MSLLTEMVRVLVAERDVPEVAAHRVVRARMAAWAAGLGDVPDAVRAEARKELGWPTESPSVAKASNKEEVG